MDRIPASWLCACALLLAGLLPVWAGPKEDGDAAFTAGKMAEAEAAYTQALIAQPDDALSLIGRGRARQNLAACRALAPSRLLVQMAFAIWSAD